MAYLKDTVQVGDWKGEKHVPSITVLSSDKNEVTVKVRVGEEIAHPNSFEHHIGWIKLYYLPEGAKLPVQVADVNFTAHGEGDSLTDPQAIVTFKAEKNGKLFAQSYCNIHGLWENEAELVLE